jgi:hypothetical protein
VVRVRGAYGEAEAFRKAAAECARRCEELAPKLAGHPTAPGELAAAADTVAWLLLTREGAGAADAAQALPIARQAVALSNEKEPLPLASLALALAQTGNQAEALKAAQKLTALAAVPTPNAELGPRLKRLEAALASGK